MDGNDVVPDNKKVFLNFCISKTISYEMRCRHDTNAKYRALLYTHLG